MTVLMIISFNSSLLPAFVAYAEGQSFNTSLMVSERNGPACQHILPQAQRVRKKVNINETEPGQVPAPIIFQ